MSVGLFNVLVGSAIRKRSRGAVAAAIMHLFWIVLLDIVAVSSSNLPWEGENSTLTSYTTTSGIVSCLEPDRYITGNILFSLNQTLYTTDGIYQHVVTSQPIPETFVSEEGTTFKSAKTTFTQLNETYLSIAFPTESCIKRFDRRTTTMDVFAGKCEVIPDFISYVDGSNDVATFPDVGSITFYRGVIYVTHSTEKVVRKIDMNAGSVSTIVNSEEFKSRNAPRSIAIDRTSSIAYLTTVNGFAMMELNLEIFMELTKGDRGYRDGPLTASEWDGSTEMAFIAEGLLLVTDTNNHKLRVVDLRSSKVSTFCFFDEESEDRCQYSRMPHAATVMGCRLYLGFDGTIRTLKLPAWFCSDDQHKWKEEASPMVTAFKTGSTALHMEPDLYLPGNLLFSEYQALLTTDLKNKSLIVGQDFKVKYTDIQYQDGVGEKATFQEITSFAQINSSIVMVADSIHGCIRSVDRNTKATAAVAGICRRTSWSAMPIDGPLLTSTFYTISSIAHVGNAIFVIEQNKQRIRKIDFSTGLVSTIVKGRSELKENHGLKELVTDRYRQLVYVSTYNGLAKIDVQSDRFDYLTTEERRGNIDGPMIDSAWSGSAAMTLMSNSTLVVADTLNQKLRIVDLRSMIVSTWCFTYAKSQQACSYTTKAPLSLTTYGRKLFLGIDETIAALDFPAWFEPQKPMGFIDLREGRETYVSDAIKIGAGVGGGVAVLTLSGGIIFYLAKKRTQNVAASTQYQAEQYATFSNESGTVNETTQMRSVPKMKQR